MCDNDRIHSSAPAGESSAVSFSSSSPYRSSSSRPWPAERSRRPGSVRGSDLATVAANSNTMTIATGERLYRCLGLGRPARVGDVLLRPDSVSRATLRRWQRTGWILHRGRLVLTAKGCAALPNHQAVVEFAQRVGRSTLFL